MSRGFSLAGLLRLRHLQQELAAGELSSARGRLDENSASQERARVALGAIPTEVTSTAALYAMAAGRASMRSALSDLTSLEHELRLTADAASQQFTKARAAALSLEKLELKHDQKVAAEDLVAEQALLDELASTAWHRDKNDTEGTTP